MEINGDMLPLNNSLQSVAIGTRILFERGWLYLDPLFILLLVIVLVSLARLRRLKKGEEGRTRQFLFSLLFLLALIAQVFLFFRIVGAYKTGNYLTVEGEVENFDPRPLTGHKDESFDIGDVHFFYSGLSPGYRRSAATGGVITGDGQKLRIRYVPYRRGYGNVIMYIEELE